ncbi:helix-turn-helix domain-containing protein [Gorillibacterium sp. sgz500922]|uniref:helix-turn-helix domain-containing protein n=1 Tax=Gorillibacterium sp. sgz500922 TaxID=3446694 RepID=UPI003F665AF5
MIGDRIKYLREQKGLTITELAEMADISKSYLSHIERKLQNNPSLLMLSKLAESLDTHLEFLLGEEYLGADPLDEEWKTLIYTAIQDGMRKEDFVRLYQMQRQEKEDEDEIGG